MEENFNCRILKLVLQAVWVFPSKVTAHTPVWLTSGQGGAISLIRSDCGTLPPNRQELHGFT